jgi:hypothetical protein
MTLKFLSTTDWPIVNNASAKHPFQQLEHLSLQSIDDDNGKQHFDILVTSAMQQLTTKHNACLERFAISTAFTTLLCHDLKKLEMKDVNVDPWMLTDAIIRGYLAGLDTLIMTEIVYNKIDYGEDVPSLQYYDFRKLK